MLRFIHAADLHLDSPFSGLRNLPSRIRERVINACYRAFTKLIDEALRQEVDFVLFAGDVFDQANRSVQAQLKFRRGLERLAQHGIHSYIVHGNHDPLAGQFHGLQWPDYVHVFPADSVRCITHLKDGQAVADIYGISFAQAKETRNLAAWFQRQHERFSIGLLHTNCIGAKEHETYAPCSKHDLLSAGMDYWALGHIHQRQIVHDDPLIIYPGNIQGRHSGEQGEKGCLLVEVQQRRVRSSSFLPLHDLVWLERTVDLSGFEQLDQVHDAVLADMRRVVEEYQCPALLRYQAQGETGLATLLNEAETSKALLSEWQDSALHDVQQGKEHFAWVESFRFHGISPFDRFTLEQGEDLYADVMRLADRWKEDEQLEALLQEVCSPLLHHHRARKYLESFSAEEMKQIVGEAKRLISMSLIEQKKR
jgi:exonuclease SbcD